jgi:hypothetical protein
MRTGLAHQDARDDLTAPGGRSWAKLAGWMHGRPSSRNRLAMLGEVTALTGAPGPGVRRLEYGGWSTAGLLLKRRVRLSAHGRSPGWCTPDHPAPAVGSLSITSRPWRSQPFPAGP